MDFFVFSPPDAIAVNGNTTHYVNQFKRINGRCKNHSPPLTPCNVTQRHDYKNEEHKPNPTPPSQPRSLSPCFPSEAFAQGFRECRTAESERTDAGLLLLQLPDSSLSFLYQHTRCCFYLPFGLFLDFSCLKICAWCSNVHRASRQRKVVSVCTCCY